ncbi:MAG: hypothetical protein H6Q07_229 [Acidobacteria bacterium]|nr:hypothetical protein [Acidobacteriota bacterium]
MSLKRSIALMVCVLLAVYCFAQMPKGNPRGKAELKAGAGTITIDYGRPDLKGRDMLAQLPPGESWRMGNNQSTTFTTPVDLMFGSTKIAKGSYSLFLKRADAEKYELVFNSETGQWGMKLDGISVCAIAPARNCGAGSAGVPPAGPNGGFQWALPPGRRRSRYRFPGTLPKKHESWQWRRCFSVFSVVRDSNQPVSCFFGNEPVSFAPSGLSWRPSLPGVRFAHPWLFSDRPFGACVGMSFTTKTSQRARFG